METAYHCLRAVVYGPFLEDSEFQTRLGLTRSEAQQLAGTWPEPEDPRAVQMIVACINEVCHGIRFSDQEWRFWFSESPEEIRNVYLKWKSTVRGKETPRR